MNSRTNFGDLIKNYESFLDSHVFIWSYDEQHKLSQTALEAMFDSANTLFLSVASAWEIQIKIMIGKFKVQDPLADVIAEQQKVNGLQILPVKLSHALYLENLPLHHKDPFNRLLISQRKFYSCERGREFCELSSKSIVVILWIFMNNFQFY